LPWHSIDRSDRLVDQGEPFGDAFDRAKRLRERDGECCGQQFVTQGVQLPQPRLQGGHAGRGVAPTDRQLCRETPSQYDVRLQRVGLDVLDESADLPLGGSVIASPYQNRNRIDQCDQQLDRMLRDGRFGEGLIDVIQGCGRLAL
jgi:hypothetical protein